MIAKEPDNLNVFLMLNIKILTIFIYTNLNSPK